MRKPVIGLGLALLIGLPALAGPESKQESEAKALQRIAKSFGKLESYAVTVHVSGGQAEGPDHRITKSSVNTTYTAVVHGQVQKVETPKEAYRARLGGGGAIANGTKWSAILSTDEGRLLERLFQRPEAVLAECVRMKSLARWVEPGTEQPAPSRKPKVDIGLDVGQPADAPPPTTKERGGEDDDQGLASEAPVSNHLRITAPPTVAIEHFTRIQNSGCFAEG